MLPQWLRARLFPPPPAPSFENVVPTGRGWYKWSRDGLLGPCKWRRFDPRGPIPAGARWLSENKLLEMALDAIIALRWKKERKVKIL